MGEYLNMLKSAKSGQSKRKDGMKRQTLRIEGMSCQHCVHSIEDGVKKLPGVLAVKVNLDKKEAVVELDDAIMDLATIMGKIKELGFSPESED